MEIVFLNEDNQQLWNDFCRKSPDAWFWHTTKLLDYCVSYGGKRFGTRNLSFFVKDAHGIVAIVPLLLENKVNPEFSMSGNSGYIISPAIREDLGESSRVKILKLIFDQIDQLAVKCRIACAALRMTPLALRKSSYNWLLKYGYLDVSTNTQIIDLSLSLADLRSAIRKGHRYDISRGEKNYDICIFNQNNPDKQAFEQYRLLHHKAAGCVTRPAETFDMMYKWLVVGEAALFGASYRGKYVGFSLINLYKDSAVYGSSSDDPDFKTNIPISHIVQWKVICWLKEKGYKNYEIGEQIFGPSLHRIPTAKDISISLFKRGFGGKTIPVFRGIKYYDKGYMMKCLKGIVAELGERT